MAPSNGHNVTALPMKHPRILITRTDRMGDLLLSTPVFRYVKERYPDGYVAALVAAKNRQIVDDNPHIDEVIAYDKNGTETSWWQNIAFAAAVRAKKFDVVVNLHPTNRMHAVSALAGIPRRIGYDRKWGFLLTDRIPEQKRRGERHESQYNFDLMKLIDVDEPRDVRPEFYVTAEHAVHFEEVLKTEKITLPQKFVVINPGASCPSKIWPEERFAELIDKLYDWYRCGVVIIGDKDTHVIAGHIMKKVSCPVIDLVGKLDLKDLGVLFRRSVCLISNDTGPVHLASAVNVPVLAIFGRSDPGLGPKRWGPLGKKSFYLHKPAKCSHCLAHQCPYGFSCLKNISVNDVLDCLGEHRQVIGL